MRASPLYGVPAGTGQATMSLATSSVRTAAWWSTPPKCKTSTRTTRSAAPRTGNGRRGAPTIGAFQHGTPSESAPLSGPCLGLNEKNGVRRHLSKERAHLRPGIGLEVIERRLIL